MSRAWVPARTTWNACGPGFIATAERPLVDARSRLRLRERRKSVRVA
jgi:hypothetical protein